MRNKHAIIIGANGLVGSELTKMLLEEEQYDKVTLITRREIELEHEKLESLVIDFRNLHKYWDCFKCDDMFYCLGTTMNKVRKKSDFYKVEHDYCVNIAKISQHNKVKQFLLISSKGADPNSFMFYPKVKGQIEQAVEKVGFDTLHIFRPSVLMGKRAEFRFLESISKGFLSVFNFAMVGFLKNIKGMPAQTLAKAMIEAAKTSKKGVFIHTNRMIHEQFK